MLYKIILQIQKKNLKQNPEVSSTRKMQNHVGKTLEIEVKLSLPKIYSQIFIKSIKSFKYFKH